VLPPLGLSKPFPVFLGVQAGLLAAQERFGATLLSVVHSSLPFSRIWAVACNAISGENLQPPICRIKGNHHEAKK
jgi:hypothetical protein